MGRYGIPDNPALWTTSRVRAWLLNSIWGYKIVQIKRQPRAGWFGRLTYDERYLLCPRDSNQTH